MASSNNIIITTFLLLLILLSSFSFTSSKPLIFPLTHYLSTSNLTTTTHHLLKSTTTRSTVRFHRHHRRVSVPLSPGTDYTMSFNLGSPIAKVTVYMDTGSDTVWLPCKPFTCIMCEGKYDPKTPPKVHTTNTSNSISPVTCQSRACSAAHSGAQTFDLCAAASCPLESIEMSECEKYLCPDFYYAYGDGSFVARLYKDRLEIPMSAPPALEVENFIFGCAHQALGEPIGVAGFGRGELSLPAQLAKFSPRLGSQFSYCLVSHSFDQDRVRQPSPLILGRVDSDPVIGENGNKQKWVGFTIQDDFAYTAMLENPKHPYYYYVGLEAVTVGDRKIPAPENMKRIDRRGDGGMVVDSGTTYTMLPEGFYNMIVSEFGKRLKLKRAGPVDDRTGLSPCYYVGQRGTKGVVDVPVPRLVFHFGGNSSVVMPTRNYFYKFVDSGDDRETKTKTDTKKIKRNVGCMTLMNGGYFPDSGGLAGLLGNYQQQGLEVVYDLLKKRVGFARRKCASLWDTLS
ncbi:putative aspartyl protease At4g16563 [Bidens hawaiensis]|uniref:putative aspartyl protease At4g16563 n=1 Tax=Bidens hawaiensis TaxID=980011 RepID=UPI004049DF53